MREILFRGKRVDNGEKVVGTCLTLKQAITERKGVFICECGNETTQWVIDIEKGKVKSCGCKRYIELSKRNVIHGGHGTRLYRIWRGIFKRCNNPNATDYLNYGARGISVCKEWASFEAFKSWALSNGYKDNLTIDRTNENGNYEPNNCRWATMKEQSEHKRKRKSMPLRGLDGRFVKGA